LTLLLVVATGCDRPDVQVYIVPKETSPATPPPAPPPRAAAAGLRWTTPVGWQELPRTEFRVASFRVTGDAEQQADVSVIPLPGTAGGDLSNVNRWRGQVGLPPITETELASAAQTIEAGGQPAAFYELTGKDVTILAAIQVRDGVTWFYKMTGDSPLVAREKAAFLALLKSFQFGPATDSGRQTVAAGQNPRWNPPPDWRPADPGPFLVAKFLMTGPHNAEAAVNISSAPGDGGGLLPNINRWRGQLGLEPVGLAELDGLVREVETDGGRATVVEMNNESVTSIAWIVTRPEQTWFYRLVGETPAVAAQREAFAQFVRAVQY
jgi:hypothetical protein